MSRASRPDRYTRDLLLLMAPYLLGTALLVIVPAFCSVALAFTRFDALSRPVWRGLWNFREVFRDPLFSIAVRNSLLFAALAVPLRLTGALGLAMVLRRRRRGVRLLRTAVLVPTLIPDVAYALIWLWIFNPLYGPLNMILGALGLPAPAWLVDPRTALLAIVIMSTFQLGEGFIVLLAVLHDLPGSYYDAAAIDGASGRQMFRWITLPLLVPWLVLLTVRDLLLSVQSTFTPAFLMTGGDPYYATLFVPLLIYEEAFDRFRFGHGSAIMVVVFLGIGVVLGIGRRVIGGWGYTDAQ